MDKTDTSKDEHIRTEFARAFGWYEERNPYENYDRRNLKSPTWEQIFVEVGRLLNRSQTLTDTHYINSLETRFQYLEEAMRKLTEK